MTSLFRTPSSLLYSWFPGNFSVFGDDAYGVCQSNDCKSISLWVPNVVHQAMVPCDERLNALRIVREPFENRSRIAREKRFRTTEGADSKKCSKLLNFESALHTDERMLLSRWRLRTLRTDFICLLIRLRLFVHREKDALCIVLLIGLLLHTTS